MARVHQLLEWANKREVARELTRRGFPVSGETLNRWVRDQREVPPVVERLVLEMYGLAPDIEKEAPPHWAVRLLDKVDAIYERQGVVADEAIVKLTRVLATGDESERVRVMRAALADALAETAHGVQPIDEPAETTSAGGATGESPPLPRPSGRSLEG